MLRRMVFAAVLAYSCSSCAGAPPPEPAPPPPAPPAPPAPEPVEVAPAPAEPAPAPDQSTCTADPSGEEPVETGELGQGDRIVRVLNNGGVELRARLVDRNHAPAIVGTLRIAAGETGTFRVPAGSYHVRYRIESNCQVWEGSAVHLTGPRSGVEIGLKPLFEKGSSHQVRPVEEAL